MKKWLVVLGVIGIALLSAYASGVYYKSKYKKVLKTEKQRLTDSITSVFESQKELIETGTKTTIETRKKARTIDDKLKQDEEAIDNSTVTDTELTDFLAKYD